MNTTSSPLISVIIPNYNEQANVKRGVLKDIHGFLSKQEFDWEVLISDDGSTDESPSLIKAFARTHSGFRFLANPHAGKPHALRSGIQAAQGQYVLLTDMDQSTPISELTKLLPYVEEGFQVVIGSRSLRRANSSPIRQLASIIFPTIRRAILLPRVKDTQCGFKLIQTKLARDLFAKLRIFLGPQNAKGWKVTAYDVEMLFLARKKNIPIKEIRVAWRDEDTSVNKSRNFIKESLEMLVEILRVRVNDLLGKYDQ